MFTINTTRRVINLNFKKGQRCFVALANVERTGQEIPFKPKESFLRRRNSELFYVPFGLELPADRYHYDSETNRIGHGMFATVYRAVDTRTRKHVAIKVIDKKKCHKQIFKQEIRVMDQIKSSLGVTAVEDLSLALNTDTIETADELKFVFKLCNGGDLFDDIFDNGCLSESEARAFMKKLVPAISALHKRGFVHRDIKPENVLLSAKRDRNERCETAVLADFGYAKKIEEKDAFNNPAGTFGYVAPEVLSTRYYSTACDIWSLGSVLFTAKAAYQPFPQLSEDETALKAKTSDNLSKKELEAITKGSSDIEWQKEMARKPFQATSEEFKDLLQQMLALDHTKRITAEEIMAHPWMAMEAESEQQELLQGAA